MSKNTLALADQSSAKGRRSGKTYRIPVSTGIFEHCPDMLDAIWLFLWYIDRTTREEEGEGFVLGGVPIPDLRPASELRVRVKTARKWRNHLKERGYIRVVRTPYGHIITLLKSKKWDWGPGVVSSGERDLPNGEISMPVGDGENSLSGPRDLPNREPRILQTGSQISPNGKYKEDKTELNRDTTVDEADATALSVASTLGKESPIPRKESSDLLAKNVRPKRDAAVNGTNAPTAAPGLWERLGVRPGSLPPELRELCEGLYVTRGTQTLSVFIGLCMNLWVDRGHKIPSQLAKAKAQIREREKREKQAACATPELEELPWAKK